MDTQLVRSPVYQQLNQRLRSSLAGEYRSGDQFLTEREVAEKFQVSRATANKSLASLVSEGFLEFRKGVGTFVRRDVIDYDVRLPALEVVSVGFLENDSPLWWERTLYRGDQYEFHSRLGPIQSATPARGKLR